MEKRQGYQYEHLFSYNWEAMKGYHYLMRLGHMFNVLAQHASRLADVVRVLGMPARSRRTPRARGILG